MDSDHCPLHHSHGHNQLDYTHVVERDLRQGSSGQHLLLAICLGLPAWNMQLWFAKIHSILGIPQFLPSFLYLQSRDCADSELTDRKPVAPEAPGHPVPWGKSCWQTQCHPALRGGTGHWNANTGHGFARCRTYYLHSIQNTGHI